MKLTTTKTLLALSLSTLTAGLYAAPYEITDLGGLDGERSIVYDINQAGTAVGFASGPLDEDGNRTFFVHAVQYDTAGNLDLGTLPEGTISEAVGINDAMVSVGYANETSENDAGQTISKNFPVVFEGGTVSKLPDLAGLVGAVAYDVNNQNVVILGGSYDVDSDDEFNSSSRAFVFDRQTEQYTMIEPFAEGANRRSFVTSIDDNGDLVGFSDVKVAEDNFSIASYITNVADVSTLTQLPSVDNREMFARSVNSKKEVVGNIYISGTNDQREAFYVDMSTASPQIEFLGFFADNFNDSRANDINNMGQVVGRALISVPTLRETAAFLYENGEMKDLNKLVACNTPWKLTEARAINDSGQIIGVGSLDGEVRTFRLDPTGGAVEDCGDTDVPEPDSGGGSIPMVLLALLAAVGIRRKYA